MLRNLGPQFESAIIKLVIGQHLKHPFFLLLLFMVSVLSPAVRSTAQSGGHTLYGDFRVEEREPSEIRPISFNVILYTLGGRVVARQTLSNNGRYRFIDVPDGEYNIVVEVENSEAARIRVTVASPLKTDFRQDILMEWRPNSVGRKREKVGKTSVADYYERAPTNHKLFDKAKEAIDDKNYEQGMLLLRKILNDDPKDFQAWTELGTVYLAQKNMAEAEKAYVRAVELKPKFLLALMNLGKVRLMQRNFDGAVAALGTAVEVKATSAEANYYLGEAYLQIKKGSKAVGYLYEALKLDPIGKAEAHLRLAALYNGAGMKDKAAVEYEEFLKKKPDYSEKKKLEAYIAQNKKH